MHASVRSAPAPTIIPTAAALLRRLHRDGFRPGFPSSFTHTDRAADLAAYRLARCPACASRLTPRPFHRPAGGYRLVLACPACGAGEMA